MDRVKQIWYLSPMRAAKVQASLRIRAVSPEPSLLAHTSSESRGTFRQKARSLAPLNGWACAVKICHDGMLEDRNSLDAAHILMHQRCMQMKWPTVLTQNRLLLLSSLWSESTLFAQTQDLRVWHLLNVHVSIYSYIKSVLGSSNNYQMSHVLRKPVFAICEQQRRRSACASAHSDQQLCRFLLRQYNIHTCYIQNFKTLASHCS